MYKCPIVTLTDFSRFFLMKFSVRPVQVLRKTFLIALRRLDVVGLKLRHGGTVPVMVWFSGTELYLKPFLIFVSQGGLPAFLFACSCFLLLFVVHFFNYISCLSSVMVCPSSYKTPNDISGAVFVFGEI